MRKKYLTISKVKGGQFVKYNVNDLVKFANYLNTNFGGFLYINVYEWTKKGDGKQIASYTKNAPPKSAHPKPYHEVIRPKTKNPQ